jgi:hypothetical protein
MSAGMLFEFARFFTLPVDALFEGYADTEVADNSDPAGPAQVSRPD